MDVCLANGWLVDSDGVLMFWCGWCSASRILAGLVTPVTAEARTSKADVESYTVIPLQMQIHYLHIE
jgi:hypothetical protein